MGGGRPPHVAICFGFGGRLIATYPPKGFGQPCIAHVHNVGQLLRSEPSVARLAAFPGPITRGGASTDTVADFATRMALELAADGDTSGGKLLWELLAMLSKSYGNVGAADSAGDASHLVELLQRSIVHQQAAAIQPQASPEESRQALEALQHLIVAGKKQEALKHAMATRLWPHALILAQQISPKAMLETAVAFAQGSLPDGDPARTLYMLIAQHPQEIFRGMSKLGPGAPVPLLDRWAENIAAIIANRGLSTDRAVIGEIGDRLWSVRGAVAAAHFCYLVADHSFGFVENPNTRIVLLGADHKRRPTRFVTPEAIQATECFEFAKTSGNPQFTFPHFQAYKLIYAHLLADAGMVEAAQKYVSIIAAAIKGHRGFDFNPFFLAALAELEERLKKHVAVSRTTSSSWASVGAWLPTKKLSRLFGDRSASVPPPRTSTPPVQTATALPIPKPASSAVTPPPLSESPSAAARAVQSHVRTPSSGGGGWISKLLGRKSMVLPEESDDIKWDEATHTWRSSREIAASASSSSATPSTPMAAHSSASRIADVPTATLPTPTAAAVTPPPSSSSSSFMAMAMAAASHAPAQSASAATPKRRNPRYIDPMTQQVRTAEGAQQVPAQSFVRPTAAPPAGQFFVPAHDAGAAGEDSGVPSYAPLVPSPRPTPQPSLTPSALDGTSADTTPIATPHSASPDKPDLA